MPRYNIYISDITVQEINNTKQIALKKKLSELIYRFNVLKVNSNIKFLANRYVGAGIFSEAQRADALHVAIASFHGISYLASWNFEHLVKVKTRRLVSLANVLEGFKGIEIIMPTEL